MSTVEKSYCRIFLANDFMWPSIRSLIARIHSSPSHLAKSARSDHQAVADHLYLFVAIGYFGDESVFPVVVQLVGEDDGDEWRFGE